MLALCSVLESPGPSCPALRDGAGAKDPSETLGVHCGSGFQPLSKYLFQRILCCLLIVGGRYAPTRVHHAVWRRSGCMVASGARAAAGEAADHWVPGRGYVFIIWPMGRCFCTAAARTRLDRGSYRRD